MYCSYLNIMYLVAAYNPVPLIVIRWTPFHLDGCGVDGLHAHTTRLARY